MSTVQKVRSIFDELLKVKGDKEKAKGTPKSIKGSKERLFALIGKLEVAVAKFEDPQVQRNRSRSVAHFFTSPSTRCKLHLDEAVTVIFNINQTGTTSTVQYLSNEYEVKAMMTKMRVFMQIFGDPNSSGQKKTSSKSHSGKNCSNSDLSTELAV